jgi:chromosome segregation protein
MQNKTELVGDQMSDQIGGLVADVVDAPEQLEMAVEAALGDRLGGILVRNHDVGVRAIQYLKDTSGGRSSFVPYGSLSQHAGSIEVEDRSHERTLDHGPAPSGEGVLGEMVELVNFEPGFDRVGRNLLSGIVVVDRLDRALELHGGGVRRPLVTLDGDLVDPAGVVTGGSREAQGAGVLAQKREIRELEEITAELERDLADSTARLVQAKTELTQVGRSLEALRTETHDGEIAITVSEKDLSQVRGELDRLRGRTTQLNAEQLELEERMTGIERETAAARELKAAAVEAIDRCEREQLEYAEKVGNGRVAVEELSTALTELKVRAAQLGEKRASVAASAAQLELADRDLGDRITKLAASIEEGSRRAASLREETAALEIELASMREQHKARGDELCAGRAAYETRLGELQHAEIAVRELRTRTEKLTVEVNGLEMKRNKLATDLRVLEDKIDESYRVSLRRNLGDYHMRPIPGESEDARLDELRSLIERMGADINLTAIEEFKEVSERHDFLARQQKDLESAISQLEKAIGKINRTSRKLFRDTFEAINAQFKEVFPRLFRGGRAELTLVPGQGANAQDPLESGVEIFAQPPGKKNSTVEQLSGGEKALTAVALIFAVFLIKPSPFCLLDEVDAPLDDTNVDRYNELIRQMTDRSQFIVITHNKRTMEIADQLYGVTMQEPGVSKLVSVNLSKVATAAA